MTKRTRNPDSKKEAILEAAEEIFLEKGVGSASMSMIANRAGITKSLIHHYFESKEGLWREVKRRRYRSYLERPEKITYEGSSIPESLINPLADYYRFLKDNPQLLRIMAWMYLENDPEGFIDSDRSIILQKIEMIKKGQKEGIIRNDIDARFIYFIGIGMIHGWFQDIRHLMMDIGIEGLPRDLDGAFFSAVESVLLKGLGA